MYKKMCVLVLLIISVIYCSPVADSRDLHPENEKAIEIPGRTALDNFPLIDGHNDLPWVIYVNKKNQLKNVNLHNVTETPDCAFWKHTNINKLKAGKVGAQFWVAYTECKSQFIDAVDHTLEVIDVIKRFIKSYHDDLEYVTTADGILQAFKNKKIGSLIALEGGHSIASRLSILRTYYELGVRYMTLTHSCNTPWADASPLDTNSVNNITNFGKKVVWEMNRLGMLVDLSHVSYGTMINVLEISKAPIIFSHSSAYTIYPHHRNVRDDVLKRLKNNNGMIMVNFYSDFIGSGDVTIHSVAKHIDHIVDVCGIDCIGIGADYGVVNKLPIGLEDVSKYPDLFDVLRESNPSRWTIENLEKLGGRNFIRVFKEVERIRDSLRNEEPIEDLIPEEDLNKFSKDTRRCKTVPHFSLPDWKQNVQKLK